MRFAAAACLLFSACLDTADYLNGAPCPCVAGFQCCAAFHVCIAEGSTCPSDQPVLVLAGVSPSESPARGGAHLVIEGGGFDDSLRVAIGGTPCVELEVTNASSATCVAPPAAPDETDVAVIATRADGSRAALARTFHYAQPHLQFVALEASVADTGAIAVFDADGDGAAELVFARDTPGLDLRRNGREPIFGADSLPPQTALAPGDFDGDGAIDLFVSVESPQPAAILFARARGTLEIRTEHAIAEGPALEAPQAIDLDGTAALDVVGCRKSALTAPRETLMFAAISEDGTLREDASRWSFQTTGGAHVCGGIAIGDLDGDGDADVAACGSEVIFFVNDGGVFRETITLAPPNHPHPCSSIALADVDADGDLDAAYWMESFATEGTTGLLHNRSGTMILENHTARGGPLDLIAAASLEAAPIAISCGGSTTHLLGAPSLAGGASAGRWLDLEGDGDVDLVLPFAFPQCFGSGALYESGFADGRGSLSPFPLDLPAAFVGAGEPAAVDFDGDGDLDLAITAPSPAVRAILRNTRAAVPSAAIRVLRNGSDVFGATIELDLDGPDGGPDFARGPGKSIAATIGAAGFDRSGHPIVLAPLAGPIHVRAGSIVQRIDAADAGKTILVELP